MKKNLLAAGLICTAMSIYAQTESEKTLIERVTNIEKKSNSLSVTMNMRGAFNYYPKLDQEAAGFTMDDLRINVKGRVNDWLTFQYLQSLNRSSDGSKNVDNLNASLNVAGLGVRMSDKFSIFVGRQFNAYGGYEFDAAPCEVYAYSQIINYLACYRTGLELSYQLNKSHQFRFQVVNSQTASFEDSYGFVPSVIDTKAIVPLQYTINWNGAFCDGLYKTRWSATYASVAKHKENYFYAFGNELNLGKFNMYADIYYSSEDIDSKTMMSAFAQRANNDELTALDANYLGITARFNYRVCEKWNIFVKGMYDTASSSRDNRLMEKGQYSTTFGYMGGVEFYPMKTNLHFFVNYLGRTYDFAERAKALNFEKYSTDKLSVGFVYKLPVF